MKKHAFEQKGAVILLWASFAFATIGVHLIRNGEAPFPLEAITRFIDAGQALTFAAAAACAIFAWNSRFLLAGSAHVVVVTIIVTRIGRRGRRGNLAIRKNRSGTKRQQSAAGSRLRQ